MAQKLNVSMPQDLDLVSSWRIRITARDSSGNVVAGVKVSNMAMIADTQTPITADQVSAAGPFMLVPGPNA